MSCHARARFTASSSLSGSVAKATFHRTVDAEFFGQRAGVDFADARDAILAE